MAPTSRATLARRLTAVVVTAAVVLVVLGLLNADRIGLAGAATADEEVQPLLGGLDPMLLERVVAAQHAAAAAGHPFYVTSGARTAEEQQRLFDEAVAEHGSAGAASRWVLPPDRSAHVRGLAVDVGPADGRAWLAEHGADYGLCLVYANEPWHFEPLVEPGGTCPDVVSDASRTS